jgi:CDP-diacylglycerol--glycerol-3-phosphate 3-phosphatidyltransferase
MNIPNKITVARIVLSLFIILLLLFPFDATGFTLPTLFVNEAIVVDIRYFICGVLFVIASFTDFIDGYLARKTNQVTDFGKMMDAIADKVLVDSVLIILASTGFISAVIAVIIVVRDIVVDSIKMVAGSKGAVVSAIKSGKLKTIFLMFGIALTLFYNLPFELLNLKVADACLSVAAVLSILSAIQYYNLNKQYISMQADNGESVEKIDI